MIPHHRGAIMMSEMAMKGDPPELREAAKKIVADQNRGRT